MEDAASSDARLWELCRRGDGQAFGLLFDRHVDAVYRYCFRRCGSWSDAEELTSVTFLEAWRKRGQVQLDQDSLLPWLLGVATHADHNRRRAVRRYSALLARLPKHEDTPDVADRAVAKVDAERRHRQLAAAAAGLSQADRDVVALCLQQGLTYEQAAIALGVPVGTVRSRLSRARARLRQLGHPTTTATSEAPGESLNLVRRTP